MSFDEYINRILELDFKETYTFLSSVLRDPSSNITVFALLLGALTILVLLIILALVIIFSGGEEEYEEYDGEEDGETPTISGVAAQPVVATVPVAAEEPAAAPVARTPLAAAIAAAMWLAVIAAVWVGGGYVSGQDAICVSCHIDGSVHVARLQEPKSDPHSAVKCVYCHETSNVVESLTTAVPARAVHYVAAMVRESLTTGYGVPVANRSCAGCHAKALVATTDNPVRGLRMSHAEPLEARALCSDCHEAHVDTGVVDRFITGMEPCMRCHDQEIASAECTVCHSKDVGNAVRSRSTMKPRAQVVDISCDGCHSQDRCDACHGIRMPHTQEFKTAMHAREAVEDIWRNGGRACKRCHTPTRMPCSRCHKGTFPGHPPNYMPKGHQSADPFNNGCDTCHNSNAWIAGRNFCGLCHPQYGGLDPDRLTRKK